MTRSFQKCLKGGLLLKNEDIDSKEVIYDNIKLISNLSTRVGRLEGALEWLILEIKIKGLDLEFDLDAYKRIMTEEVSNEN